MADRPTTCSSCGGPGHRSPTCGREPHYKCSECGAIFKSWPRIISYRRGYCDGSPVNKEHDLKLVETIEPAKATAAVFESKMDAILDKLQPKLEPVDYSKVQEFVVSAAETAVNNNVSRFENTAKVFQDEVEDVKGLLHQFTGAIKELQSEVATTQKHEVVIQINDSEPLDLGEEFPSPVLEDLIMLLSADIPGVMLFGPAGCGKSFAAEQYHRVMKSHYNEDNWNFVPLSFSEGLSEADFYGRMLPAPDNSGNMFLESEVLKTYEHGGVILADELDGGDPNLILILNRMVEYDEIYNPRNGRMYRKSGDVRFIATMNTTGRGGDAMYQRNRLDGSTLDRFCMVLEVGYNEDLERKLCPDTTLLKALWAIRKHLLDKGEQEFISSRKIKVAYRVVSKGYGRDKAIMNIIRPWPQNLKAAVLMLPEVMAAFQPDNQEVIRKTLNPTDEELIDEMFEVIRKTLNPTDEELIDEMFDELGR